MGWLNWVKKKLCFWLLYLTSCEITALPSRSERATRTSYVAEKQARHAVSNKQKLETASCSKINFSGLFLLALDTMIFGSWVDWTSLLRNTDFFLLTFSVSTKSDRYTENIGLARIGLARGDCITSENLGMNRLYYCIKPKNWLSSVIVLGIGHLATRSILPGSILNPSLLIRYPKRRNSW